MKKSFVISQQYLLLPIKAQEETRQVAFYCEGKKILEFAVPVSDCGAAGDKAGKQAYAFNYYAPIPMREWMGKEICIEGDVPENFLEAIAFSEEMPDVAQRRPLIHFSANVGWLNDPNGLMYHDGVYHMFFQYNPCDTRWQNMSWGHAVSRDLLHWEQKETALLPDEDGPMYSGSAIVNEQGKLGLPRDAEILFYTCAGSSSKWSEGKKYVQKIAYSTDGKTFQKREGCVLENVAGENRDPKVYWHEGKQVYYMALFLEGYDYAIFNSRDLEHWEMTQRLSLPNARECPDLQKVPVEGGGYKWMFWGADDGTDGVKVFGMEHYWGNLWRCTAGLINNQGTLCIKATRGTKDGSSSSDYNTSSSGYIILKDAPVSGKTGGYISKCKTTPFGRFPYEASGSATTFECDGMYFMNNQKSIALFGGMYNNDLLAGPFCVRLSSTSASSSLDIGAALSCKPLAV